MLRMVRFAWRWVEILLSILVIVATPIIVGWFVHMNNVVLSWAEVFVRGPLLILIVYSGVLIGYLSRQDRRHDTTPQEV